MAKKIKKLNLKQLLKEKDKAKNIFRSRGYSLIKRTFINEKGQMEEEFFEIEIQPIGDSKLIKEYAEKYPKPKPPVKRDIVDLETGQSVRNQIPQEEIKAHPEKYGFANIFDFADEKYQKEIEEWQYKLLVLQIMVAFDVVDEFGIDKIEEFEKWLEDLGFTSNQLNKIGRDINNLDFLPESK